MKKFFLMATFVVAALAGCKEDEPVVVAVDPDKVEATEVRLIVNLPASVATTKATDKFNLAGSFKDPNNAWKENGSFPLVAVAKGKFAGKFEIRVPLTAFDGDLEFKVQRNGSWNTGEKDKTCGELASNRKLARVDAGKSVEITVENFRNTGTCPN